MNYICHLNAVFDEFAEDDRLQPNHISLYLALFQFWNNNRFRNPIIAIREDLMNLSKIGSTNTYTKCIKELDKWGYVEYEPSFNPIKGSRVNLLKFDKGSDEGGSKGTGKAPEKVLRPIYKHSKQDKYSNRLNAGVNENKNYDKPL